jgi:hypothetical protein
MSVAMTFGGTISVQSRSFERYLCTFCKSFRLQIDRSAFFVKMWFLRNFASSQTVVVVFRELPPSVVALDWLGLSLKLTLNGGALAAQYRYARRDNIPIAMFLLGWVPVASRIRVAGFLPLDGLRMGKGGGVGGREGWVALVGSKYEPNRIAGTLSWSKNLGTFWTHRATTGV